MDKKGKLSDGWLIIVVFGLVRRSGRFRLIVFIFISRQTKEFQFVEKSLTITTANRRNWEFLLCASLFVVQYAVVEKFGLSRL